MPPIGPFIEMAWALHVGDASRPREAFASYVQK
jgi:hypothetical protein